MVTTEKVQKAQRMASDCRHYYGRAGNFCVV